MKKKFLMWIFAIIAIIIVILYVEFIKATSETNKNEVSDNSYNLSSDEEVKEVIDQANMYSAEEIFDNGGIEYSKQNYKIAYNLYKLAVEKLEEQYETTGEEISLVKIGVAKMLMSLCYRDIDNYVKAWELIDESNELYPDGQTDSVSFNKKNIRSAIYVDYTTSYGFERVEETEQILLDLIDLEIKEEGFIEDKKTMVKETKEILARLYTLSPKLYNPQMAIELYLELLEEYPENTSYRYSLIHAYIQNNEYVLAKEYWEELKKLELSDVNNQVIGVLYNLGVDNPEKAKDYLKQLKKNAKDEVSKIKYYQVAANYYSYIGEKEEGQEYLKKILDIEIKEIYTQSFITLEKELEVDYSKHRDKIVEEYKRRGSIDLEVE